MGIITVNKNLEKLLGTKDNYFTIEAVTSGTVSIRINEWFEIELYCSVNDNDWELLKYNEEDYTKEYNLNVGDKIHFKCDKYFSISSIQKNFKFNAMGFLSSLWKGDNCIIDNTLTRSGQLANTFSGAEIVDASKLILPNNATSNCYDSMFKGCTSLTSAPELPATTLAEACYSNMFNGCTSLTSVPSELPATTLAEYCYNSMFYGCTSLTTAPKLPATTMVTQCYRSMFQNCTSLASAPSELPATTLTNYCYISMFKGCTHLTKAPKLPATTLVDNCYYQMFQNCTSLNNITMLAEIFVNNCFTNWVSGVASTGTFTKAANTTLPTGNSGIPTGWTVELVDS